MSLLGTLRSGANGILTPFGFQLVRSSSMEPPRSRWSTFEALSRVSSLGLQPQTLIDVGAASGEWFETARSVFPSIRGLLIEPLAERTPLLEQLALDHPGTVVVEGIAGNQEAQVSFNVTDDLDGSGVYGPKGEGKARTVDQLTIDGLIQKHDMSGSYLLKLDTHGYEIPILEGAEKTLDQVELIVVEAYGFKPSPTAVRFWELCTWLETKGFRCADLSGLMGRQRDGLFWQADFYFLREDHSAFLSDSYR